MYRTGRVMATSEKVKTVGVKEFRDNLAEHLLADTPIAVTKHGLTVGYYIPTHQPITADDKRGLREAAEQLNQLLEAQGLEPETLIKAAQDLRKKDKRAA